MKKSPIVLMFLAACIAGLAAAWFFYAENKKHFAPMDAGPVVHGSMTPQ